MMRYHWIMLGLVLVAGCAPDLGPPAWTPPPPLPPQPVFVPTPQHAPPEIPAPPPPPAPSPVRAWGVAGPTVAPPAPVLAITLEELMAQSYCNYLASLTPAERRRLEREQARTQREWDAACERLRRRQRVLEEEAIIREIARAKAHGIQIY